MRNLAGPLSGIILSSLVSASQAMMVTPLAIRPGTPSLTSVEYFCSPGFEPGRGGTCVAVPSRAEIELFVDQPIYDGSLSYRHRARRRHHTIRERF